MRLIDADKLIKAGWHLERSGRSNRTLGVMSIADVPTAYDPEKVVEQLEAELYRGMESLDPVLISFNFGINKAIEIVKGGAK